MLEEMAKYIEEEGQETLVSVQENTYVGYEPCKYSLYDLLDGFTLHVL